MFGFSHEEKTVKVLERHFGFLPSPPLKPLVSAVCHSTKGWGNEYDAAITFVIEWLRHLDVNASNSFATVIRQTDTIISIFPNTKKKDHRSTMLAIEGLRTRFNQARSKPKPSEKFKQNYPDWDSWLRVFKEICARENPQLALNEKGGSFVDFMEHEPIKRAYNDGIEPSIVAVQWARDFDMVKLMRDGRL